MRHVDPVIARKGAFLKSFSEREYQEMLDYCHDTEMAMFKHHITNQEVVYSWIGKIGSKGRKGTWQVFLCAT